MILIFFPVQFNFIPFNSNLSQDDNPNIILPLITFLLHTRSSLYYYRIKTLSLSMGIDFLGSWLIFLAEGHDFGTSYDI
jgi:hypothetical protein